MPAVCADNLLSELENSYINLVVSTTFPTGTESVLLASPSLKHLHNNIYAWKVKELQSSESLLNGLAYSVEWSIILAFTWTATTEVDSMLTNSLVNDMGSTTSTCGTYLTSTVIQLCTTLSCDKNGAMERL